MSDNTAVLSAYKQLSEILEVGSYPGSIAAYVSDSRQFIQRLIKVLEDAEAEKGTSSTNDSVRNEKKRNRFDDSGVTHTGRKNRKRN
jgi:hypothetical protein